MGLNSSQWAWTDSILLTRCRLGGWSSRDHPGAWHDSRDPGCTEQSHGRERSLCCRAPQLCLAPSTWTSKTKPLYLVKGAKVLGFVLFSPEWILSHTFICWTYHFWNCYILSLHTSHRLCFVYLVLLLFFFSFPYFPLCFCSFLLTEHYAKLEYLDLFSIEYVLKSNLL